MMKRADKTYVPAEGCSAMEIIQCLTAEDFDACKAACSNEEEEENLPGYATVSAKAAASQTVALNAVDKKIGTVTLKAGENDTTITNIQITKSGLGDSDGIKNVSLVRNDEYATNSVALKNNVATLRFSPALTIKANSSETFDVVVSTTDAAGTVSAGGQYDFAVTSVNVANGTFGGTPAKLGSLTTTNYKVKGGTVTDLDGANVKAGDEKVTIATVSYKPDADAIVNSITLTSNQDELYNAFTNAKAYIDDELVGTVSVNNDTIVIKDMNKEVEKSDTIEVVVKADVVYVGTNGTFAMSVEENHVNAVEKSTNERMATAGYAAAPTTNIVVTGLGVTLKNNGEKTTTTVGAEVTLLDMTISSAESVDVTQYYVDFGQIETTVLASFDDIVISIDGSEYDVVAGSFDTTNTKQVILKKTSDKFNVSADNSVKVKVTAKAKTSTPSSYTLEFGMTNFKVGTTPITGTTVKKSGHTTTIGNAGSLTLTKTSTDGSTITNEAKDILAFTLKAKNETITVSAIELGLEMDDVLSGVVESIELYQGTTQLGDTLDEDDLTQASAGHYTVAFNGLGQQIKADETLPFTLRLKLEKTDSDVIGKVITGSIANGKIVAKGKTSKNTAITNTTSITGKGYQVTTAKSTVSIEKAGKIMYVTVNNNSDYPMVIKTLSLDVNSNMVDGNNMLKDASVAGYTIYKDNTEGDVLATKTQALPGTITETWTNGAGTCSDTSKTKASECIGQWDDDNDTLTPDVDRVWTITTPSKFPVVGNGSSAVFAVEMDTATTIENTFYDAVAKSLVFYYIEDYSEGDVVEATNAITEKY